MAASRLLPRLAGATLAASLSATTGDAAVVSVNYVNPSDGFHSSAPPDPLSTAPGATLGEQRKASFEAAAADWGSRLTSSVAIVVDADMVPMSCSSFSAILGGAGPNTVIRDWTPGAGGIVPPHAATWYHSALANKLAGTELIAGSDVGATFNSSIDDNDGCLSGTNWYYATAKEPAPPNSIAFFDVVLHEIGHGIGVSTFVGQSGARFFGFDDIYMRFLEDHTLGLTWNNMTDGERATSAVNTDNLHWIGPAVQASSAVLTAGLRDGHVPMYAPNPYRGGSSVSHFDTSLNASGSNELMEPFATASEEIVLTDELLEDEGWGTVAGGLSCGNGTIEPGEECDDGGDAGGDGCSAICSVEPCYSCDGAEPTSCTAQTGTPCDDGQQCTTDVCSAGICQSTPESGTACDDGIVCTVDVCSVGLCIGDPTGCDLDPFKLYKARAAKGASTFPGATVSLEDEFEAKQTIVGKPTFFGNAADTDGGGTSVPEIHLECYKVKDAKKPHQAKFTKRRVQSTTALGSATVDVLKPVRLCVPSAGSALSFPAAVPGGIVDGFKCYKAKLAKGQPKFAPVVVGLDDELESRQTVLLKPAEICNPVDTDGGGILNPAEHMECYKIKDAKTTPPQASFAKVDVFVTNLFGTEKLTAIRPQRLCLPSTQTEF